MTNSDPAASPQPANAAPAPVAPAMPEAAAAVAGSTDAPVAEVGVLIAKEPKAPKAAKAPKAPRAAQAPKAAKAPKVTSGANLGPALAAKIAKLGLSAQAAAGQIGVGILSLNAVLKGESKPNSRTIARYSAWIAASAPAPAAKVAKVAKVAKTRQPRAEFKALSVPAGSVKAAFAQIRAALSAKPGAASQQQHEETSGDKLALAVHHAPEAARQIIQALLKAF